MKKVIEFLCKIGSDKYVHLLVSLLLTFVFSYCFYLCSDYTLPQCAGMGSFAALLLGCVKECYDEFSGGEVNYADLCFDFVGCVLGLIVTVW